MDLWSGVDRLIDRAPSLGDLESHGLHLLAARRWEAEGRELPQSLAEERSRSAWRDLLAPAVLQRAREAYDGKLLLLKGPAVARLYPSGCRPFGDLDIVAEEPEVAQRALMGAGFEQVGFDGSYYEGLHHLSQLRLPDAPQPIVEIHRRPNWVDWGKPPSRQELFSRAVPAGPGAEGYLVLPPGEHAVVVAAHGWTELPLRRILDLLDVLVLVQAESDRRVAERVAAEWGLERVWSTVTDAAAALLCGGPTPASMRIWARSLPQVRDRTVLENHLRKWLSVFWALPPRDRLPAFATALAHDLTPVPSEGWHSKLRRASEAIRNPSRPSREHLARIGPDAYKPRFKRRY